MNTCLERLHSPRASAFWAWIATVIAVLLAADVSHAAGNEQPAAEAQQGVPPKADPTKTWSFLSFTAASAPSTSMRIWIESAPAADKGSPIAPYQVAVEWSPSDPVSTAKIVYLPPRGPWRIRAVDTSSGKQIDVKFACKDKELGLLATDTCKASGDIVVSGGPLDGDLRSLILSLPARGPSSERTRGLESDFAEYATDLGKILAEIVIERVSNRAYAVVRDMIANLCSRAKWPQASVARFKLEGRILPKTCDALEQLELRNLSVSGDTLARALANDLATTSMRVLVSEVAKLEASTTEAERKVMWFVGNLVAQYVERGRVDTIEVALALETLKDSLAKQASSDRGVALAQAAFGVAALCLQTPPCSAGKLAGVVRDLTRDWPLPGRKLSEYERLAIARIATKVVLLASPPQGTSEADHLKNALALATTLLEERSDCPAQSPTYVPLANASDEEQPSPPKQGTHDICRDIGTFRRLSFAVIDRDTQAILSEGSALVVDILEEKTTQASFSRVMHVLAAAAAYAKSAPVKADGSVDTTGLTASKDARKKAIEDLIDATTDRRRRDGEWIASIGGSLGVVASAARFRRPAQEFEYAAPQLSLPLGVAIQKMPASYPGIHLQLSAVDFGQYAAYTTHDAAAAGVTGSGFNKARADSFLLVGFQGGALIGSTSFNVLLAADVRYAPTMLGGSFQAGLAVSSYVPFFDFN